MSNQNIFSTLIVAWVAVPSLAMFLGAGPARAQNSPANYTFLVASGFLCDPGDSATCPAVVKSANGDSYEMSGAGTFNTQSKSVTAAGTFTHKSSDGTVLETGVWIVSELVSFDSYGIVPGALLNGQRALGSRKARPQRICRCPLAPCQQAVSRYSVSACCRCREHQRRGAAGELRLGESTPRTPDRGYSTLFGKEWHRILSGDERARDVPLDAPRSQRACQGAAARTRAGLCGASE